MTKNLPASKQIYPRLRELDPALARMMFARALTKIRQMVGEYKIPSAIEWIENFLLDSDEKLIVFGYHVKVVEKLQEKFKNISVMVNGSVRGKERERCH